MVPLAPGVSASLVVLALLYALPLAPPAYCQITDTGALADRESILGQPFALLKDDLERSFPREEMLETWGSRIAAAYPSLSYVMIANYENRLVYSFYKEAARAHATTLQQSFRALNKFSMKEGTSNREIDSTRWLVSHEKLVIEMDTYYFEFGFGPLQ
jgi:hypothetical protein